MTRVVAIHAYDCLNKAKSELFDGLRPLYGEELCTVRFCLDPSLAECTGTVHYQSGLPTSRVNDVLVACSTSFCSSPHVEVVLNLPKLAFTPL